MFDFPYDARCYYKAFDDPCTTDYITETRAHFDKLPAAERRAAERGCGHAAAIVASYLDHSAHKSAFEAGCN